MWSRTHAPLPLVDPELLRFCIDNHLNVLLQGRHGVGKTTVVREAFAEAGLKLLVLSGPTMDPWVDFVGVPRPITRPDGSMVLELVRRPELADDAVDGIFIDEFNRAPAKVRNAALELLQFRSVNGHRFERLRTVWAAINPADEDFDAEQLDPAQLDRFHIHIDLPYRPCPKFFVSKYGSTGRAALEWWDAQSDDVKKKVSPRRLDYALRVAALGGPVRKVLPGEANARRLIEMIEEGPVFDTLKDLLERSDRESARALMQDPKRGSLALNHILRSKAASVFFLPLLDTERIVGLLSNAKVLDIVVTHADRIPEFLNALTAAQSTKLDSALARKVASAMKRNRILSGHEGQFALVSKADPVDAEAIARMDPYGRLSG